MNIHYKPIRDAKLSRRTMLKGGAGLVLGVYISRGSTAKAQSVLGMLAPTNTKPNTFLTITPDNLVTVLSKHIEWGRGR